MSIKSKKWYENQIKALERATEKLHRQAESLANIYRNELPELFKAQKPLIDQIDKLWKQLDKLKEEYYLYYR